MNCASVRCTQDAYLKIVLGKWCVYYWLLYIIKVFPGFGSCDKLVETAQVPSVTLCMFWHA